MQVQACQQNNPLSPNMPTQLSADGIRQLLTSSTYQQLLLQIIKISDDYSDNKRCHLSDGFCYITCFLTGEAKLKNIKGDLEVFDVVKITKESVILLGLDRMPVLELCDIIVIGMRLLCAIGEPIDYITYSHNEYTNHKGSRTIADGQRVLSSLTIPDLVEKYPHVPPKWVLKARVIRMPDTISIDRPFMIIRLMDQKSNIIQGVFFGQVAIDSHKKLAVTRQYLFSNGQIKTKKSNVGEYQIKFTDQSQIIPIEGLKNSVVSTGGNVEISVSDVFKISQDPNPKLVTLVGKVRRVRNLAKGRSVEVIDRNSDYIEIVLWEEIQDQIIQGNTYSFEHLKIKNYRNQISLQSVRSKTVAKRVSDIEPAINTNQNTQNQVVVQYSNKGGNSNGKELRQYNNLLNVAEIVDLPVREKEFKDIRGYLVIPTTYMDIKNFFKVSCSQCPSPDISSSPVMCKKCSSTKVSIRWNIRSHIIDQKQDIKCYINEQLCEKLLKMGPVEAFIKLNEDKEGMRKKIQEVSHLQGIWKIKINPIKDSIYYNVVDVYRNDSVALLRKAWKDLQGAMKNSTVLKKH